MLVDGRSFGSLLVDDAATLFDERRGIDDEHVLAKICSFVEPRNKHMFLKSATMLKCDKKSIPISGTLESAITKLKIKSCLKPMLILKYSTP